MSFDSSDGGEFGTCHSVTVPGSPLRHSLVTPCIRTEADLVGFFDIYGGLNSRMLHGNKTINALVDNKASANQVTKGTISAMDGKADP